MDYVPSSNNWPQGENVSFLALDVPQVMIRKNRTGLPAGGLEDGSYRAILPEEQGGGNAPDVMGTDPERSAESVRYRSMGRSNGLPKKEG